MASEQSDIRDHDHDLHREETREYPHLGGREVELECSDCDYWRCEWRDTVTLRRFA